MNLESIELNYLFAILGGVAYFALGWAWYSPLLFVNRWLAAQGKSPEEAGTGSMGPMLALNLLAGIVTVFVVAAVYEWAAGDGVVDGIVVGLIVGVGVVAMELLKGVIFYSQSWTLFLINAGYAVVGLGLAGAIYGAFA